MFDVSANTNIARRRDSNTALPPRQQSQREVGLLYHLISQSSRRLPTLALWVMSFFCPFLWLKYFFDLGVGRMCSYTSQTMSLMMYFGFKVDTDLRMSQAARQQYDATSNGISTHGRGISSGHNSELRSFSGNEPAAAPAPRRSMLNRTGFIGLAENGNQQIGKK